MTDQGLHEGYRAPGNVTGKESFADTTEPSSGSVHWGRAMGVTSLQDTNVCNISGRKNNQNLGRTSALNKPLQGPRSNTEAMITTVSDVADVTCREGVFVVNDYNKEEGREEEKAPILFSLRVTCSVLNASAQRALVDRDTTSCGTLTGIEEGKEGVGSLTRHSEGIILGFGVFRPLYAVLLIWISDSGERSGTSQKGSEKISHLLYTEEWQPLTEIVDQHIRSRKFFRPPATNSVACALSPTTMSHQETTNNLTLKTRAISDHNRTILSDDIFLELSRHMDRRAIYIMMQTCKRLHNVFCVRLYCRLELPVLDAMHCLSKLYQIYAGGMKRPLQHPYHGMVWTLTIHASPMYETLHPGVELYRLLPAIKNLKTLQIHVRSVEHIVNQGQYPYAYDALANLYTSLWVGKGEVARVTPNLANISIFDVDFATSLVLCRLLIGLRIVDQMNNRELDRLLSNLHARGTAKLTELWISLAGDVEMTEQLYKLGVTAPSLRVLRIGLEGANHERRADQVLQEAKSILAAILMDKTLFCLLERISIWCKSVTLTRDSHLDVIKTLVLRIISEKEQFRYAAIHGFVIEKKKARGKEIWDMWLERQPIIPPFVGNSGEF
ncbi:hypothetical protein K474DRAFT_1674414 [Panus rudis PR-1116 ss-1]|nr:hypothetical protein K474DRAFT_1674414 [Panus rudis PR-1116 ss-1]